MNAPVCPVSRSQPASSMGPTLLSAIPPATDLPSLIRTVNILRDIINNITTSLTVNNIWLPRTPAAPPIAPNKDYIMSPYPTWYQAGTNSSTGFVFYKAKSGNDEEQRAYIQRIDQVEFRNINQDDDKSFYWHYKKALDSGLGDSKGLDPFKEDFFERVVNVHWSTGLAVEFYDGAN